jgi:aryl-alcohol dehydrogenase
MPSMTTVTAAVAREHRAPLSLEQLELDEIRDNEVRVRMVATGVCHTDAVVRDGGAPTPLPAVLGHEGTGVVEDVGRSITTVSPGDHVVLAAAYCGTCRQCRSGLMAYCENLFAEDFGGRRGDGSTSLSTADGTPISSHFFGQSSFSTYANVVETSIVRVDWTVPPEVLAPLGCGINTGAGSVLNELRPPAGSSFAVTGAGAVGLAAVMAARVAGCTTIVAVDLHDSRLELAREIGATHTINSRTADMAAELSTITGGEGVNYVLDTTGVPAVVVGAAGALSIRGTVAVVGAAAPGTKASIDIDVPSLVKGWTFKTIVQGSSVPQVFIPRLVELWKQGRFPLDKLVRTYKLDDINSAFTDSESGVTVKPVVVF